MLCETSMREALHGAVVKACAHKFRPELEVRGFCLTPLWPFLFAVQDADDLDLRGPRAHTINDDERRRGYDKLASAAPPPSPARLGIFAQHTSAPCRTALAIASAPWRLSCSM